MAAVRILVVDDFRTVADSLARLLRTRSHDVRVAYDGRTALAIAAELEPQVVLLDPVLPDMHGTEVARELRARHATIVIVAISSSAIHDPSAYDECFLKPFGASRLDALLANLVRSS